MVGSGGAIVAIARGITRWLSSYKRATITIQRAGGSIIAQNVSSKDISEVLQMLTRDLETKDKGEKQGALDAQESSIAKDVTGR
jgi:hypothetical protein